jgi:short-subunit dehydrogenase
MKHHAVIFGTAGGIGAATKIAFINAGYTVTAINRSNLDMSKPDSDSRIHGLLSVAAPDVVVNCAGHFGTNSETHDKMMDVNVGANWSIVRHYIDNPSETPVKIIMIGSSAYKSGRKNYILYAASKAALYNLWQGTRDYFEGSNTSVSLINPVRTRTKMIDTLATDLCLEPEDVANEIVKMASTSSSECVDMEYPKEM